MAGTIKPEDFSHSLKDATRSMWTMGKIEHVVAALQGKDVLVETDRRTGHAVFGNIVGYASSGDRNPGARLQIVSPEGYRTNYLLAEIGVIVETGAFARGKWDALDSARKGQSAAIAQARAKVEDPEAGRWTATGLGQGRYYVTRERQGERSYQADSWEIALNREPVA